MKYKIMIMLLLGLFLLAACGSPSDSMAEENTEAPNMDADVMEDGSMEMQADVDSDGDADVEVTMDGETAEVTIEMETPEVNAEEFCVGGSTFTYDSEEGSVDSEVIGFTTYQDKEFCIATSTTVIESAIGQITTETTYYFDSSYSEYYIFTKTSGAGMPAQENQIHLINGEVQE